jgi:hypothetical protein
MNKIWNTALSCFTSVTSWCNKFWHILPVFLWTCLWQTKLICKEANNYCICGYCCENFKFCKMRKVLKPFPLYFLLCFTKLFMLGLLNVVKYVWKFFFCWLLLFILIMEFSNATLHKLNILSYLFLFLYKWIAKLNWHTLTTYGTSWKRNV